MIYSDKKIVLLISTVKGLVLGLSILWLSNNIESLGRNIPAMDIYSDYMTGLLWAIIIAIILFFLPLKEKIPLLKVWSIKVFVVLVFMLFYEEHYGLDAYEYFEEAIYRKISMIPEIGRGSENIIRFNMILIPIIGKSFHALKVVYSLLGLIGVYLFYKAASRYTETNERKILYFLAFFPSILFWSSIIGKDPVILLLIGFYTYNVISWLKEERSIYLLYALLSIGLSVFIRGWLAVIGGAPLIFMAILKIRHPLKRTISLALSIGFTIWAGIWFQDYFHLENTRDIIDMTEGVSRSWAYGGSAQRAPSFSGFSDMIVFFPFGAFTSLFRPLPWEAHNFFALLSSMENTALLVFTLLAIKRFRLKFFRDPVVLWAILLISVWTGMYGFVSYQNLGTAARFKLQILPVFLMLLILIVGKKGQRFLIERLKVLPGIRK